MEKQNRKKWNIKAETVSDGAKKLSRETGIGEILAVLLENRGYCDSTSARAFLSKSDEVLHDPFLLNDMEIGAKRILSAIKNREKITIYGDYDVDGVTSVSILYLYLEKLGADVNYYIPSRKGEGYGVSENAIRKLYENGTKIIVTVDTGVTANEEIDVANSLGIDVIVSDHHECRPVLPNALAVINPKRVDTTYPFSSLAGVGVVFKLLCAVETLYSGKEMIDCVRKIAYEYADLTAIGTIADVMPITDENRLIVSLGLKLIENTEKVGLSTLINICRNNDSKVQKQKTKKKISSGFVGFTVAPRINAAGRISEASIAVDLLISKDEKEAERMALSLCDINKDRQIEENNIADEAYNYIERNGYTEGGVIVLENPSWHHGVIGIVASRVSEKYALPAILISFEGNEDPNSDEAIGKGSGRSVKGMNLVNALSSCSDLLEKFGGHELAAGLSIRKKNLPEFMRRMNEYAKKCFGGETPVSALDIDCILTQETATLELASELELLEPYGVSNPMPVFAMKDVTITDIVPVGMNRHLKLTLSKNGTFFTAMYFCVSLQEFAFDISDEVDVAFNLEINDFMNNKTVQFNVKDIKASNRICADEEFGEKAYKDAKDGKLSCEPSEIIPTREDAGVVYNFLLKEAREGRQEYSYIKLLRALERKCPDSSMNYVKLKLIIKIFRELNVIAIREIDEVSFEFKFNYTKTKTNLEKSNILKKLKSMYLSKVGDIYG